MLKRLAISAAEHAMVSSQWRSQRSRLNEPVRARETRLSFRKRLRHRGAGRHEAVKRFFFFRHRQILRHIKGKWLIAPSSWQHNGSGRGRGAVPGGFIGSQTFKYWRQDSKGKSSMLNLIYSGLYKWKFIQSVSPLCLLGRKKGRLNWKETFLFRSPHLSSTDESRPFFSVRPRAAARAPEPDTHTGFKGTTSHPHLTFLGRNM